MDGYMLGIDQSTQGTKALLFDASGNLICRTDLSHQQIVNEKGWVSHDPEEIYQNTIQVVKNVIEKSGISKENIIGAGISNQRETALVWERDSGRPIEHAVVWQCARANEICERINAEGKSDYIKEKTGIQLSPYFPAAKIAWILEHTAGAMEKAKQGKLCYGTIDTWLVYKLTDKKSYKTDYSNASRTQLFDLETLEWNEEICSIFKIPKEFLAKVCDSNSEFGKTDFDGYLDHAIPIHGVLGDSHGALFGQGCLAAGMTKATYGTGSSVMMNVGDKPIRSKHGIVTSLAWGMDGKVSYVLEGNINYTGAVITWMEEKLGIIQSPKETQQTAKNANQDDAVYLIPAFTGLGAPYWESEVNAALFGISRTTSKAEIVRAGLESIAYQITDIVEAMKKDTRIPLTTLRVDGGPTRNDYLMQFQSDMLGIPVQVPAAEELSGIGAAYAAGIGIGLYDEQIFKQMERSQFLPIMEEEKRNKKYEGWLGAVKKLLTK